MRNITAGSLNFDDDADEKQRERERESRIEVKQIRPVQHFFGLLELATWPREV